MGLVALVASIWTALEHHLDIQPGERRRAWGLALLGFLVVGAFAVGRNVRDALFLGQPGLRLDVTMASAALAVAAASVVYQRVFPAWRMDRAAFLMWGFFAALLVALRVAWPEGPRTVAPLVFVAVEVMGALAVLQFSSISNDLLDVREMRRLTAVVWSGGVIANLIAFPIRGILPYLPRTADLLFVPVALLLLGLIVLRWLARDHAGALELGRAGRVPALRAYPGREIGPEETAVREQAWKPLRRLLAVAGLAGVISLQLLDFQFKSVVGLAFADSPDRARDVASFMLSLNGWGGVAAVVIQFSLAGLLLRRFGVTTALSFLPLLVVTGSALVIGIGAGGWIDGATTPSMSDPTATAGPVKTILVAGVGAMWILVPLTVVKAGDLFLRYTLHDPSWRLLYRPIPPHVRIKVSAVDNGMVRPLAQAGTALALFALAGAGWFSADHIVEVSTAILVLALLWMLLLWPLRRAYVGALSDEGRRLPPPDETGPAATEALRSALRSDDPAVLAQAVVMAAHRPEVLSAARLAELRAHPHAELRLTAWRATADGAGGRHAVGTADWLALTEDSDPQLRALALSRLALLEGAEASPALLEGLDDPDPQVRGEALAGLIRHGDLSGLQRAVERLSAMVASADSTARENAAAVLAHADMTRFVPTLLKLVDDPETPVRRRALEALAKLCRPPHGERLAPRLLDAVVPLLATRDTRTAAAAVLAALGDAAVAGMEARLSDSRLTAATREGIAAALGRIPTPNAARALARQLTDPQPRFRRAVIDALRRQREAVPALTPDRAAIRAAMLAEAHEAQARGRQAHELAVPVTGLAALRAALAERRAEARERILDLLGLLHSPSLVRAVAYRLASPDPAARAGAVEALDNLLDTTLRVELMPLLDGRTPEALPPTNASRASEPPIDVISERASALPGVGGVLSGPRGEANRVRLAAERYRALPPDASDTATIARLRHLAHDPDPWLRACALEAVRTGGFAGVDDLWLPALDDPDPVVREVALRALADRGDQGRLYEALACEADPQVLAYGRTLSGRPGVAG